MRYFLANLFFLAALVALQAQSACPQSAQSGTWHGTIGKPGAAGAVLTALPASNGVFYVGGNFHNMGGVPAEHVAVWTGSTWQPLGSGLHGTVRALAQVAGGVFAGGDFDAAGEQPAAGLAFWDGKTWLPLPNMEGLVLATHTTALAAERDILYAGGNWLVQGVLQVRVAMWAQGHWTLLGTNAPFDGEIRALAVGEHRLYAGGSFASADGVMARHIAQWDGQRWSDVGGSVDQENFEFIPNDIPFTRVDTLAVHGRDLYIGGSFLRVGGVAAQNVARWDGAHWYPCGGGVPGIGNVFTLGRSYLPVSALAVSDFGELFVGGGFGAVNGDFGAPDPVAANLIAKWDGINWSALGSGMAGKMPWWIAEGVELQPGEIPVSNIPGEFGTQVLTLVWDNGQLLAGGDFTQAGGAESSGVALWCDPHRPRVHVAHGADGSVVLSWPAAAAEFAVQMADTPNPEAWTNVERGLIESDDWLSLSVPPTARTKFFRLMKRSDLPMTRVSNR